MLSKSLGVPNSVDNTSAWTLNLCHTRDRRLRFVSLSTTRNAAIKSHPGRGDNTPCSTYILRICINYTQNTFSEQALSACLGTQQFFSVNCTAPPDRQRSELPPASRFALLLLLIHSCCWCCLLLLTAAACCCCCLLLLLLAAAASCCC
jgi:hypothetical protein